MAAFEHENKKTSTISDKCHCTISEYCIWCKPDRYYREGHMGVIIITGEENDEK